MRDAVMRFAAGMRSLDWVDVIRIEDGTIGMRALYGRVTHHALGAYLDRTFLRFGDGGMSLSTRAVGDGGLFIARELRCGWGRGRENQLLSWERSWWGPSVASEQQSGRSWMPEP